MSNGEYLYLALVIGSFAFLGLALPYLTERETHAERHAASRGRPS